MSDQLQKNAARRKIRGAKLQAVAKVKRARAEEELSEWCEGVRMKERGKEPTPKTPTRGGRPNHENHEKTPKPQTGK